MNKVCAMRSKLREDSQRVRASFQLGSGWASRFLGWWLASAGFFTAISLFAGEPPFGLPDGLYTQG
jgi:hypothetical protein